MDPHHEKFSNWGIHLPDRFAVYKGYNDLKKKKEKEPRFSSDGLQQRIEQLSGILMQPWISSKRFEVIRADVEKLTVALQKYREYLVSQCKKATSRHLCLEPSSAMHPL